MATHEYYVDFIYNANRRVHTFGRNGLNTKHSLRNTDISKHGGNMHLESVSDFQKIVTTKYR